MNVHSVFGELVDLLAPLRCAGCDLPFERAAEGVGPHHGFCDACGPLLEPTSNPRHSVHVAAFVYGGPLADAVQVLKYERRVEIGMVLGEHLAAATVVFAGQVDRVIPVPLHVDRLRARGFNQAALLARPVARSLGVRLDTRSLERVRPAPAQVGQNAPDRALQVRAAFRATRDVEGARVLLVDDVRTTGATLFEAQLALRDAGAERVLTAVLAQAP